MRNSITKPTSAGNAERKEDEEETSGNERCVTREVGPSMPHMSAKEEASERSSRTSREESEEAEDGMRDNIAKPTSERSSQGRDDECKTRSGKSGMTREVGPSMRYPEETSEQNSHTPHEESEGTLDGMHHDEIDEASSERYQSARSSSSNESEEGGSEGENQMRQETDWKQWKKAVDQGRISTYQSSRTSRE